MNHLDRYLEELNQRLPAECSEHDLTSQLPAIFGSRSNISRKRKIGLMPPFLEKSPGRFIYLKPDVLDFIRDMYKRNSSASQGNKDHA